MSGRAGYMTLRSALLGGIVGAPLGLLVAFFIMGEVVHATASQLAVPFILCWVATAALSPFMYWADRRAVETANPRFIVLKIAPYFIVAWSVFGYLLVRYGLVSLAGCALIAFFTAALPLGLLWARFPAALRRVLNERHAAAKVRGPG